MNNNQLIIQAEKLYKTVNTFILSCIGDDGFPLTKAVAPGKFRESITEMFFCTNTSSVFASAIRKNEKATVYFYSREHVWEGCMLKGKMDIVNDIALKEKYWQTEFKDAYPKKSFTDPDFCLLRFTPANGRYYSCFSPRDFEI